MKVKCLAQEHNTMSPVRAQSGVQGRVVQSPIKVRGNFYFSSVTFWLCDLFILFALQF